MTIPNCDVVLFCTTSKKMTDVNKVASAICGQTVYGSAALIRCVSPNEYASFDIVGYETQFPDHLATLEELGALANGRSREETIAEFEAKEELGRIVRRVQFMRNKEGGNCSTVQIVREITETAFTLHVKPDLVKRDPLYYESLDWEEYKTRFMKLWPHYTMTLNINTGKFSDSYPSGVTPSFTSVGYYIYVTSFESEEAKLWSRIADSDVSRVRAMNLKAEIAKRSGLDQDLFKA